MCVGDFTFHWHDSTCLLFLMLYPGPCAVYNLFELPEINILTCHILLKCVKLKKHSVQLFYWCCVRNHIIHKWASLYQI